VTVRILIATKFHAWLMFKSISAYGNHLLLDGMYVGKLKCNNVPLTWKHSASFTLTVLWHLVCALLVAAKVTICTARTTRIKHFDCSTHYTRLVAPRATDLLPTVLTVADLTKEVH